MDEQGVIAALTADRQIDQLRLRGIKNDAGHAYNPSYYKRGLNNAIERGGLAVADYVRGYLYKPPSDGYKKPEIAHALDLACEWLVLDETKPCAALFTDADRRAARVRAEVHAEVACGEAFGWRSGNAPGNGAPVLLLLSALVLASPLLPIVGVLVILALRLEIDGEQHLAVEVSQRDGHDAAAAVDRDVAEELESVRG